MSTVTHTDRNVAVVTAVYERFNDGDIDGIVALCRDDAELLDVPSGGVFRGHDGIRNWMQVWKTAVPDSKTELTSIIADGDVVVTEHVGRGTHTGPLMAPDGEIPATGRSIELCFAEVFELQDGKIIRLRAYTDTMTFLRQIGVVQG